MWKNELRKAERLPGTPDILIALGKTLENYQIIGGAGRESIFYFFEKPYNYQKEYEILLDIAKKYNLTTKNGEPNILLLTDYTEDDYEEFSKEVIDRL